VETRLRVESEDEDDGKWSEVELLKKFPCPQVSDKFQLSHEAFFLV
jgi:hypothetical protein